MAEIYGYEVKRNITSFLEDFMFQVTTEEESVLKSQFATSRFVIQSEMWLVMAKVLEILAQVASVVNWKNKAEEIFDGIQRSIDIRNENF